MADSKTKKILSVRSKLFYLTLFFISLLALILRLEVGRELFNSDFLSNNPPEGTDMQIYLKLAGDLLNGSFHGTFYYQPFYYIVFLPFVFLIFGHGAWGVIVAHSILGAVTVWLTGVIGAMVSGRRSGIIAALLVCVTWLHIMYAAYALIVTFNAFLILVLIYSFMLALRRKKLFYWGLVAALSSSLILLRANMAVFVPVLLFIGIREYLSRVNYRKESYKVQLKKSLPVVSVILFFFLLVFLPFCLYNSLITGKVSGPTVGVGSLHFALGNNPEAPPGGLAYTDTLKLWVAEQDHKPILKSFFEWVSRSPLRYIEMQFRKFLLFWDASEIGNNVKNLNFSRQLSPLLRQSIFLPLSFTLAITLASFFYFWKRIYRKRRLFFLFLMVIMYCFSIVLFMNMARYRMAILPLFAIFAGIFINLFFQKKRYEKVLKKSAALFLGIFIVFLLYPIYTKHIGKKLLAIIQPNGVTVNFPSKTFYFDYGPNFQKAYRVLPFLANMKFCKKFAVPAGLEGETVQFQFPIKFSVDTIKLKVNNRVLIIGHSGKNNLVNFTLPFPEDGAFYIENCDSDQRDVFLYLDTERDYSRTFCNGIHLNGELVGRLVHSKKKVKSHLKPR